MKQNVNWIFLFLFALISHVGFAQSQEVTGTVVDNSGLPLPGVNVIEDGTSNGTQTDFDGNFSIEVEQGAVLVFSYLGMKEQKVTVGSQSSFEVTLKNDTGQLDEVVITALGITREKKSLGYSTQQVAGEDLTVTRSSNAINSLSGRVAGVQISNSSANLGGSTRILIRGIGSVTQENRPLYVIDGVPLANDNFNPGGTSTGGGGRDFGDTGSDINPDDIENMQVLKGGPAAALYGNRAINGVILITTKSGKKGKGQVVVNSGLSFESVNVTPNVQKKYGGGAGNPNTLGPGSFNSQTIGGTDYQLVDYATDESWGPQYDPNTSVLHWDAFDPEFADDFLNPRPWVYPENDQEDFFRTGVTLNNSVSFSNGDDNSQYRASISNIQAEGVVPNSNLDKTTVNFNGTTKVGDKLKVGSNFNYTRTSGFNRPSTGYSGNSVILQFYQFGQTQLDSERLKKYVTPSGQQRTWNRVAFDNPTPRYTDNPYWIINNNTAQDERNRFYGKIFANYQITDDLSAEVNAYGDTYGAEINQRRVNGSQAQSFYSQFNTNYKEFNYEGRLSYNKKFLDNKLTLNAVGGLNRRDVRISTLSGETQGGLIVNGLFNLGNSANQSTVSDDDSSLRVNSVFATASVGYDNFLYLNASVRNDWDSSLPADNNSYLYPSVSSSLVFSELVEFDWLNFGKLRGGYAQVGGGTDPNNLRTVYSNPNNLNFLGNPTFSQPGNKLNPNLLPEQKKTWEIGLEMGFLKNRISFDFTYYNERTEDLITPVSVDPGTGYTGTTVNAGELENKGIELLVNVRPIETEDFSWDVTVNFARNRNKLLSLIDGVESLQLARFPFNGVSLNAVVGEAYGQIRGTNYVFDDLGNKVISAGGSYLETQDVENLGSILPDFNMGIRNSISYKNFRLSALIDIQQGGKFRSLTNIWGNYSGILEQTARGNIREEGVVLSGVTGDVTFNDDGSYTVTNTATNTTVISAQQEGQDHFFGNDNQNVFDADYVKLRELNLTYTFNKEWFGGFVQDVQLSAFGRNLAVWGLDNENFDPEIATGGSGNVQGSEGGSLPSTLSYGLNLQLKF
ncbi:SusC/RagA family TonB-linked outer membrane protein [Psychroflexus sp. MES1-P1E]|uniref:SusC/RagA family TonB-linked outer membrane protein n=1 Tax=Psychroflexus sp. MES1-P1E TaxID=2058320 RepID=UPI000C7A487A|nr:SusC/RagA family TonB-linked outer membrane protein [Psychroflexus sp. MES1-P1E]PKG44030.1 SusC/RagA family TonB-linked outer membrane protein [Psychroflexus sp. MES1-P1E]